MIRNPGPNAQEDTVDSDVEVIEDIKDLLNTEKNKFQNEWLNIFPWLENQNGFSICICCKVQLPNRKESLIEHEKDNYYIHQYEVDSKLMIERRTKIRKKGKRSFRNEWLNYFSWLQNRNGDSYCLVCNKRLSSDRAVFRIHENTKSHIAYFEQKKKQFAFRKSLPNTKRETTLTTNDTVKFRSEWLNDFDWLDNRNGNSFCLVCNRPFVNNKAHLARHENSVGHQTKLTENHAQDSNQLREVIKTVGIYDSNEDELQYEQTPKTYYSSNEPENVLEPEIIFKQISPYKSKKWINRTEPVYDDRSYSYNFGGSLNYNSEEKFLTQDEGNSLEIIEIEDSSTSSSSLNDSNSSYENQFMENFDSYSIENSMSIDEEEFLRRIKAENTENITTNSNFVTDDPHSDENNFLENVNNIPRENSIFRDGKEYINIRNKKTEDLTVNGFVIRFVDKVDRHESHNVPLSSEISFSRNSKEIELSQKFESNESFIKQENSADKVFEHQTDFNYLELHHPVKVKEGTF